MLISDMFRPTFLWEGDEGGGGSGDPGPDPANPGGRAPAPAPTNDPAPEPDANAGLKTALESERTERKRLERELKNVRTKDLPEGEKLKAERDTLKDEVDSLKGQLAEVGVKSTIESQARELGFKRPSAALGLLKSLAPDVDIASLDTDEKAAKALRDLASDNDYLVTTPPPSGGPVNPQGSKTPNGTAGFNQTIREAAGRR